MKFISEFWGTNNLIQNRDIWEGGDLGPSSDMGSAPSSCAFSALDGLNLAICTMDTLGEDKRSFSLIPF